MKPVKLFMSNIAPINAMPFDEKLKRIELAAKIGKRIPHPGVQKVAHTADLAVKSIKSAKKSSGLSCAKVKKKKPSIKPE
jgi:hypothetical protein